MKRILLWLLFSAIVGISTSHRSSAQWVQTNGPYGGNVQCMVADTNGAGQTVLFVGTDLGSVLVSRDEGRSWTQTSLKSLWVFCLALLPNGTGGMDLLAGVGYSTDGDGGVYVSTDEGINWTHVGLADMSISSLVVAVGGLGETNLLAGTVGQGIFRSTDRGTTWTKVNSGLTHTTITSLVATPNGSGGTIFFAGTYGNGVFLSTDEGRSWSQCGLTNTFVSCLAAIPIDSGETDLLAGNWLGGIFLSTDNGATWSAAGLSFDPVQCLSFSSNGKGGINLYAGTYHYGLFLSSDKTRSWTQTKLKNSYVLCIAACGANLFAGTLYFGVYLSTDGVTWAQVALANTHITCLASSGTALFVGTGFGSGVFRTSDNGTTWFHVGLIGENIHGLAANGGNIVAATSSSAYFSTDNGATWTHPNSNPVFVVCRCILFESDTGVTKLFAGGPYGVALSSDMGVTWFHSGLVNRNVVTLAVVDSELFAGTDGNGLFRSTNDGTSWEHLDSGLTALRIHAFAASSAGSHNVEKTLFVGTSQGIFLSSDDGVSWIQSGLTDLDVVTFAATGREIYAGTNGDGVYLSTDNGISWTQMGLQSLSVSSLAVITNGTGETSLFAGQYDGSVWRMRLLDRYTFAEGWNLVSVPFRVSSYLKSDVYPTAVSDALMYEGSYRERDTLANGFGYWLKFDRTQEIPFHGETIRTDSISVVEGWNLIGSISRAVPVENLASNPGGMITSNFYGYAKGYRVATNIDPGKGYWVKVNQGGKLILSSLQSVASANQIRILSTSELPPPPPTEISSSVSTVPRQFALEQNYPNPFNPVTTISYQLPFNSFVSLEVYNVLGTEVKTFVNKRQNAGSHTLTFDASGLPSGVYFYRLQAGTFIETKKLLLLR